jgi:hypothetical protein
MELASIQKSDDFRKVRVAEGSVRRMVGKGTKLLARRRTSAVDAPHAIPKRASRIAVTPGFIVEKDNLIRT